MVRETRYLWVGNLPEKVTEEKITEHFKRYGKIQSVKTHKVEGEKDGESVAIVAFFDIKSASKAHNTENKLENNVLQTNFSEPTASGNVVTRPPEVTPTPPRVEPPPKETQARPGTTKTERGHTDPALPRGSRYQNREGATTSTVTENNRNSEYYSAGRTNERGNYEDRQPGEFEDDDFYQQRGRERFPRERTSYPPRFEGSRSTNPGEEDRFSRSKHASPAPPRLTTSHETDAKVTKKKSVAGSIKSGSFRSRSSSLSSSSSSRSSSSSSRSPSRSRSNSKVRRSQVVAKNDLAKAEKSEDTSSQEDKGERGNLGICVTGLPMRSSDTSLRDGLFHEYKKHGKVTSVVVEGEGTDRFAIVSFKKPEDAEKALEASQEKMFFGTKIKVKSHEGFEVEDNDFKPPEADLDEYHPKATRTLFIGNLEKEVSTTELKDIFKEVGEIIDIDIKKQGAVSAYAFVQFSDIVSVTKALRKMDGQHIGANKIKLGFGKSMPTTCVWVDGVAESVTEKFLCRQFGRYGPVNCAVLDRVLGRALIYFDTLDYAQYAVNEMRGRALAGKKIQIDFASRDCQNGFFKKMEQTNQLRPGERPDERGRVANPRVFQQGFEEPRAFREERDGRFFEPRGRGRRGGASSFRGRGGRNFSDDYSNRSYSEGEFRRSRHFDEYSQGYSEDYEAELRDFGYAQRERQEHDGLSPTHDSSRDRARYDRRSLSPSYRDYNSQDGRFERYDERLDDRYSDRFRDTDSQSGDRDSTRSESRRDRDSNKDGSTSRHLDEKFRPKEKGSERRVRSKDSIRSRSPQSSEYSQSPYHNRSRSVSPGLREKLPSKLARARTPPTPTRDEHPHLNQNSPMDYESSQKDYKYMDQKNKPRGGKHDLYDVDRKYESDRGSIKSEHSSTKSHKSVKRDGSRSKHKYESSQDDSDVERTLKSEIVVRKDKDKSKDYNRDNKHLERQTSRGSTGSAPSSRSRRDDHHQDSKSRSKNDKQNERTKSQKDLLSKKTEKKDSPKSPSHKSPHKSRRRTDSSSSSDSSSSDEDSVIEPESGPADLSNLQQEKLHLLTMLQQLDEAGSTSDNDSALGDEGRHVPKKPRLEDVFDLDRSPANYRRVIIEQKPVTEEIVEDMDMDKRDKSYKPLDTEKFRPIDSTQSYRKQMEARRLEIEKQGNFKLKKGHKTSDEKDLRRVEQNLRTSFESIDDSLDGTPMSPKDIPTEFLPKKRKRAGDFPDPESSKQKRSYRNKLKSEEIYSSSGDELEKSGSGVQSIASAAFGSHTVDSHSKLLEFKPRKLSHSSTMEVNKEVDVRQKMEELRKQKQEEMRQRNRHPSDSKPYEPRIENKRNSPMSLPLPRFALQAHQNNTKSSPKSHTEKIESPQVSPGVAKLTSPPFSPAVSQQPAPLFQLPPPSVDDNNMKEASEEGKLESPKAEVPKTDDTCTEPVELVPEAVKPVSEVASTSLPEEKVGVAKEVVQKSPPQPDTKEPKSEITLSPPPRKLSHRERNLRWAQGFIPAPKELVPDTPAEPEPISDISDNECPTSPGKEKTKELSLEARIRALDEKLSIASSFSHSTSTSLSLSGSMSARAPETPSTPTPPTIDYQKYRRKKRVDSSSQITVPTIPSETKTEPSDIVKSVLRRSSIFDQDSMRLEKRTPILDAVASDNIVNAMDSDSPTASLSPGKMSFRTKAAAKELPSLSQSPAAPPPPPLQRYPSGSAFSPITPVPTPVTPSAPMAPGYKPTIPTGVAGTVNTSMGMPPTTLKPVTDYAAMKPPVIPQQPPKSILKREPESPSTTSTSTSPVASVLGNGKKPNEPPMPIIKKETQFPSTPGLVKKETPNVNSKTQSGSKKESGSLGSLKSERKNSNSPATVPKEERLFAPTPVVKRESTPKPAGTTNKRKADDTDKAEKSKEKDDKGKDSKSSVKKEGSAVKSEAKKEVSTKSGEPEAKKPKLQTDKSKDKDSSKKSGTSAPKPSSSSSNKDGKDSGKESTSKDKPKQDKDHSKKSSSSSKSTAKSPEKKHKLSSSKSTEKRPDSDKKSKEKPVEKKPENERKEKSEKDNEKDKKDKHEKDKNEKSESGKVSEKESSKSQNKKDPKEESKGDHKDRVTKQEHKEKSGEKKDKSDKSSDKVHKKEGDKKREDNREKSSEKDFSKNGPKDKEKELQKQNSRESDKSKDKERSRDSDRSKDDKQKKKDHKDHRGDGKDKDKAKSGNEKSESSKTKTNTPKDQSSSKHKTGDKDKDVSQKEKDQKNEDHEKGKQKNTKEKGTGDNEETKDKGKAHLSEESVREKDKHQKPKSSKDRNVDDNSVKKSKQDRPEKSRMTNPKEKKEDRSSKSSVDKTTKKPQKVNENKSKKEEKKKKQDEEKDDKREEKSGRNRSDSFDLSAFLTREQRELGMDVSMLQGFESMYDKVKRRSCRIQEDKETETRRKSLSKFEKKRKGGRKKASDDSDSDGDDDDESSSNASDWSGNEFGRKKKKATPAKKKTAEKKPQRKKTFLDTSDDSSDSSSSDSDEDLNSKLKKKPLPKAKQEIKKGRTPTKPKTNKPSMSIFTTDDDDDDDDEDQKKKVLKKITSKNVSARKSNNKPPVKKQRNIFSSENSESDQDFNHKSSASDSSDNELKIPTKSSTKRVKDSVFSDEDSSDLDRLPAKKTTKEKINVEQVYSSDDSDSESKSETEEGDDKKAALKMMMKATRDRAAKKAAEKQVEDTKKKSDHKIDTHSKKLSKPKKENTEAPSKAEKTFSSHKDQKLKSKEKRKPEREDKFDLYDNEQSDEDEKSDGSDIWKDEMSPKSVKKRQDKDSKAESKTGLFTDRQITAIHESKASTHKVNNKDHHRKGIELKNKKNLEELKKGKEDVMKPELEKITNIDQTSVKSDINELSSAKKIKKAKKKKSMKKEDEKEFKTTITDEVSQLKDSNLSHTENIRTVADARIDGNKESKKIENELKKESKKVKKKQKESESVDNVKDKGADKKEIKEDMFGFEGLFDEPKDMNETSEVKSQKYEEIEIEPVIEEVKEEIVTDFETPEPMYKSKKKKTDTHGFGLHNEQSLDMSDDSLPPLEISEECVEISQDAAPKSLDEGINLEITTSKPSLENQDEESNSAFESHSEDASADLDSSKKTKKGKPRGRKVHVSSQKPEPKEADENSDQENKLVIKEELTETEETLTGCLKSTEHSAMDEVADVKMPARGKGKRRGLARRGSLSTKDVFTSPAKETQLDSSEAYLDKGQNNESCVKAEEDNTVPKLKLDESSSISQPGDSVQSEKDDSDSPRSQRGRRTSKPKKYGTDFITSLPPRGTRTPSPKAASPKPGARAARVQSGASPKRTPGGATPTKPVIKQDKMPGKGGVKKDEEENIQANNDSKSGLSVFDWQDSPPASETKFSENKVKPVAEPKTLPGHDNKVKSAILPDTKAKPDKQKAVIPSVDVKDHKEEATTEHDVTSAEKGKPPKRGRKKKDGEIVYETEEERTAAIIDESIASVLKGEDERPESGPRLNPETGLFEDKEGKPVPGLQPVEADNKKIKSSARKSEENNVTASEPTAESIAEDASAVSALLAMSEAPPPPLPPPENADASEPHIFSSVSVSTPYMTKIEPPQLPPQPLPDPVLSPEPKPVLTSPELPKPVGVPQKQSPVPSSEFMSHMESVINDVARGNFDEEDYTVEMKAQRRLARSRSRSSDIKSPGSEPPKTPQTPTMKSPPHTSSGHPLLQGTQGVTPGSQKVYPLPAFEASVLAKHLPQHTDHMGHHGEQGLKSPVGPMLSPRSDSTGPRPDVHVGVVQGAPYSIGQRESSPAGQVIERVPNPSLVSAHGFQEKQGQGRESYHLPPKPHPGPQGSGSEGHFIDAHGRHIKEARVSPMPQTSVPHTVSEMGPPVSIPSHHPIARPPSASGHPAGQLSPRERALQGQVSPTGQGVSPTLTPAQRASGKEMPSLAPGVPPDVRPLTPSQRARQEMQQLRDQQMRDQQAREQQIRDQIMETREREQQHFREQQAREQQLRAAVASGHIPSVSQANLVQSQRLPSSMPQQSGTSAGIPRTSTPGSHVPHTSVVDHIPHEARPPKTTVSESRRLPSPRANTPHHNQERNQLRQPSPQATMPHPHLQPHPQFLNQQMMYGATPTQPQTTQSGQQPNSELRAVLNKPPLLTQQTANLQQLYIRPPTPHHGDQKPSPGGVKNLSPSSVPRVPFPIQGLPHMTEPRASQTGIQYHDARAHVSQAPGSYGEVRMAQPDGRIITVPGSFMADGRNPYPHDHRAAHPDTRMNHTEARSPREHQSAHPEARLGLPHMDPALQMQPHMPSFTQAGLALGVPHPMNDPRMIFAPGQHAELLAAHQGGQIIPSVVSQHHTQFLHGHPDLVRQEQQRTPDNQPTSRPPSSLDPPGGPPFVPNPAMTHLVAQQYMSGGMHERLELPPHADNLLGLLKRYPVMWQGLLTLKNDNAAVQMHFVSGNEKLATYSLPQPLPPPEGPQPLRIAQRMRLEQSQLEGVARRMENNADYCMLLSLPAGRDHADVIGQTRALNTGFIQYLQQKQAAGIVNVPAPGSTQPAYVVHIFPPCSFSQENLARLAPDLLQSTSELAHLLIIIATV